MSIPATFSIHYHICGSRNGTSGDEPTHQILKLRLGYGSQLICRSPFAGMPHQIVQQTPSTLMGEAVFPLSEFVVIEFLRSFNLHASVCEDVFGRIADFAQQLAGGDSNASFQIEANIDYVKMLWMEAIPGVYPVPITQGQSTIEEDEAIMILEEAPSPGTRGAPEWAIERLMNQKFDGLDVDEMRDCTCSVCYDELIVKELEVRKMPCGHLYHKSCILTWLQRSNSCPLCRRKLEQEI